MPESRPTPTPATGLAAAIEAVGSAAALALRLGISPQAVRKWKRIPADRINHVEAATSVPRAHLRPDLFAPQPPETPSDPAEK